MLNIALFLGCNHFIGFSGSYLDQNKRS